MLPEFDLRIYSSLRARSGDGIARCRARGRRR
jgi:hypothetical protein